jgi:acetyl esterase
MRGVLDRIARAGHPPLHALSPAQARQAYAAGAGVLDIAAHKMARIENLQIPARDGYLLPARLYIPHLVPYLAEEARALQPGGTPCLLFFHGGGFTVGGIQTHEPLCRHLAHLAHCAVLSLDYRLAPEWKFPTAANDAWDSLQWLHDNARALGLNAGRLAVGGDSAGATLSAATAIAARDAGLPLALQLLFYPGTTGYQQTPTHRTFAQGFLLEERHIDYFFGLYLRTDADRDDWRFAPLDGCDEAGHMRELDGVAPVWMGLAECDPLFDEGVLYADKLRMSRVAVDLEVYAGVVHGFINFGRAIPEALRAHQDAARALRAAFAC